MPSSKADRRPGMALLICALLLTLAAACSDLLWTLYMRIGAGSVSALWPYVRNYFRTYIPYYMRYYGEAYFVPIAAMGVGILCGFIGRRARAFLYLTVPALAVALYLWVYDADLLRLLQSGSLLRNYVTAQLYLSAGCRVAAILCLLWALGRVFRWHRRELAPRFRYPRGILAPALIMWILAAVLLAYIGVLGAETSSYARLTMFCVAALGLIGACMALFARSLPWVAFAWAGLPYAALRTLTYIPENGQQTLYAFSSLTILLPAVCGLLLFIGWMIGLHAKPKGPVVEGEITSYIITPLR